MIRQVHSFLKQLRENLKYPRSNQILHWTLSVPTETKNLHKLDKVFEGDFKNI